ncbi:unnamed protein product [Oppiella nova]|uniref:Protoporphyrinogen oxidase n=1 Tax=Oppiella nova TaxID=334625 RepID=A0A7R9L8G1_9ACAR|nr:unnamed protein product [Oppiella nova]CAG2159142.1 unnamed protein product [Oppiella nova]
MATQAVVVLGGGISGLSCAYYLQKFCRHLTAFQKIIVLESSSHLGGWLKTCELDDGVKHELGPRTLRSATNQGYNALTLAEDIGLTDEILATTSKSNVVKKRFILVDNELVALPTKLIDLFRKRKPFSKRLISYVIKDLKTPKLDLSQYEDDISVYDFAEYRVGSEVANYFFDPLCRGITAGNSKKLSIMSLFPQLLRAEQESGSFIMGSVLNTSRDSTQMYASPLVNKAMANHWSTYTFRGGLQALPNRLCDHMLSLKGSPIEIYNNSTVNTIKFNETSKSSVITITTPEDNNIEIEAQHIFSSLPAYSLAKVLPKDYSDLSEALNAIKTVNMAVVNLEFKGKVMADDSGFGFLVPSCEDSKILGIVFDSCVTPEFNAGHDITRLTVMIGGEWFEEILGDVDTVDEQTVLNIALESVRLYLKIDSKPIRHIVTINRNCIPQYHLGHQQRIQRIDELTKKYSMNMTLIGASYQGFSVPDCIYNSKLAAESYSNAIKGVTSQPQPEPSLERNQLKQ